MLSGWFRKQLSEKVDIIEFLRKNSTPGYPIPEEIVQSQLECILDRKGENTESVPTTTQDTLYRCYLFQGNEPKVSQIIKRADGERLVILTKPEKFRRLIAFDCQHIS